MVGTSYPLLLASSQKGGVGRMTEVGGELLAITALLGGLAIGEYIFIMLLVQHLCKSRKRRKKGEKGCQKTKKQL